MKKMTRPNFLVIGAEKSGTTSLYHYLKQHPQIYMSPAKEPRFFAFYGEQFDESQYDRFSIDYFRGLVAQTVTNRIKQIFKFRWPLFYPLDILLVWFWFVWAMINIPFELSSFIGL